MSADEWPNDAEMAEPCGCGHTLGQHEYGTDLAPCDICICGDFHDRSPLRDDERKKER